MSLRDTGRFSVGRCPNRNGGCGHSGRHGYPARRVRHARSTPQPACLRRLHDRDPHVLGFLGDNWLVLNAEFCCSKFHNQVTVCRFDTGVYRSNRPSGPLDAPESIEGGAFEGLIAQHLHAWCHHSEGSHRLFCWQTRSQVEVDSGAPPDCVDSILSNDGLES